ncbi:hypothetical protein [Flavobacterium sp. GT3R68]|uniref:hypothetical protein n=1 Tax=Flavobacterium sp. GT3R68 TaxID=2594437 RepID=UPI000F8654E6|nr:hypothetical protein [Flavobacterium sp. GT3R68]RTY88484.1 hypothetical protein EKL32_24815 [Flavobacterium sp. GSN2]TRW92584.1 hypothetical protein FNW07_06190 [Flavobacterium sp. GT3R68]
MKRIFILFLLLYFGWNSSAQNFYLKISGENPSDKTTIDSIGYTVQHPNVKSVFDESRLFSEKLTKFGYIENETFGNTRPNDSTFLFQLRLGKRTEFIHLYIGTNTELQSLGIIVSKKDTLPVRFAEIEGFLNQTLAKLEAKGYSLAKLQLVNFKTLNNSLFAELHLEKGNKRQLNDIVINGYDKFPEGHKKNIQRLYRNKTFNQENLSKIHSDFEKFRFVNQTKYPEILFTKDTTKVYVYLEKSKPNKFDGYIGFSNDDESKLAFNGYLDLLLVNNLNVGEEFTLYWKSDGNDQKTFNIGIELPYIFRSPFGLKASLNIFKQDSTFQNTKTALDIGYFFNYNTRLYLGYQATSSSDIQNQNNFSISDYSNAFVTTNFEFTDFKRDDFIFPEKTKLNLKIGYGTRDSNLKSNQQLFAETDVKHAFYLNEKNSIYTRSQNFYLQSDNYITNELFRFGGINSIRGFNENSLQANLFTSLLTEYRYLAASNIYIHSIIDYGYFKDKTTENSGSLLGLGFGFGLLTKNGLLNLVYANGSTKEQSIKLSNSIVHISFKAVF